MNDNFDGAPSRSNLNLFYALDAILNTNSLTEAARRSNLTQPAMSLALKRAKEHFNDEIVAMAGGERVFTPLAIGLRPLVRRVLRDAHRAMDFTLDFDPTLDRRTVRISMPDFTEVVLLPHLLRALRSSAPILRGYRRWAARTASATASPASGRHMVSLTEAPSSNSRGYSTQRGGNDGRAFT